MSTFITEPGTRLAGRYRLEDRVSDTAGSTLWKAIDETLARPVAVLTFAPGFPRVDEVVTAARAASRMSDSRIAQVFDVEDAGDRSYIVLEWVSGHSLDDMVAAGPLEPGRAVGLISEASQALAAAHAAGLAHLCLTPRSLRWTPGGGIKITGLGVEAAIYGARADDPARTDTQGLGRLLYAALTAHWPAGSGGHPVVTLTGAMRPMSLGSQEPAADTVMLPPAPTIDGHLCTPRQVCAGVPAPVDLVTSLAVSGLPGRGQHAITSPAALAEALAQVTPSAALTPPALPLAPGLSVPAGQQLSPMATQTIRTDQFAPPLPERGGAGKTLAAFVIVLVVAAIGVGAWVLSHSLNGSARTGARAQHHGTHAPVAPLTPVSAHGFDVFDTAGQDGNENDNEAPYAVDGNPRTAWHTLFYENNPRFGGLKAGTGLILDMGKQVKLDTVEILFGRTAGADVQIRVGNDNGLTASTLSSFTTVAAASGLPGGDYTFHASGSSTGRYVLIWFTRLPREPGGPKNHYEAAIFNVVVRGSA